MPSIFGVFFKYIVRILRIIFPRWMAQFAINRLIGQERHARPHPYSLWTGFASGRPEKGYTAQTAPKLPPDDSAIQLKTNETFIPSSYVSWTGLVNRRYTGRHLGPADAAWVASLPPAQQVWKELLERPVGGFVRSDNTSALFCFFAQWFTDSFLRTNPQDRRQNTSNHEIDFCQIYGLDGWTSNALRDRQGGRMLLEKGLLPRLTDMNGEVRKEFYNIGYIRGKRALANGQKPGLSLRGMLGASLLGTSDPTPLEDGRWTRLYASGLERGNSTMLYTAISTMCVREHNKVAGELMKRHSDWDNDRLFETTRLIMIHNVLQMVVEDYINHIAGTDRFKLERHFGEHQRWYRTNRISLEFNLLYRWHALVPDSFKVDDQSYGHQDYRFNNSLLEQHGIEHCINAASTQPAGRVQLHNTPYFLEKAELATLDMSRTFALRPFVDYCARFGERPPQSIMELVGGDAKAAAALIKVYGDDVGKIELPIGLIAQARGKDRPGAMLPSLVATMVAVDAFTHILTNPILADQVYNAAFPADIADLVDGRGSIAGLMSRNADAHKQVIPSFTIRQPLPSD